MPALQAWKNDEPVWFVWGILSRTKLLPVFSPGSYLCKETEASKGEVSQSSSGCRCGARRSCSGSRDAGRGRGCGSWRLPSLETMPKKFGGHLSEAKSRIRPPKFPDGCALQGGGTAGRRGAAVFVREDRCRWRGSHQHTP